MDLEAVLRGSPYVGYTYGYPHKTAYRPLDPPVPLQEAWAGEDRAALLLYLHVPFCEMRCGFCNLFTTVEPPGALVERWTAAIRAQIEATAEAVAPARVARLAIGGGTPTWLPADRLAALLDTLRARFDLGDTPGEGDVQAPIAVEVSPATVDDERVAMLRAQGVERVSMGVQSFDEEEARAALRPQRRADVEGALRRLRDARFPVLNLDLIYGIPGQTEASFVRSIEAALAWEPQELYLYPLYVRPLTGLGKRFADPEHDARRLAQYRAGRDHLLERGWQQVSMRMFRAGPTRPGPRYTCQEDGTVGIGVGARSYTRGLHWSSDYAVGARSVREILGSWVDRADHAVADWGIALGEDEQRRRWLILSLLSDEGVDPAAYARRFGGSATEDFPQLGALADRGLAEHDGLRVKLTAAGLERSDAIGPWLHSEAVRARVAAWEAR
jgi:oxygen-independent coproporphyrinogen-3 oxidase